jgi:hypothetical protein
MGFAKLSMKKTKNCYLLVLSLLVFVCILSATKCKIAIQMTSP